MEHPSICSESASDRPALVLLEHACKPLSADDLVLLLGRVIDLRPDAQQRLVCSALMRSQLVVADGVLRDDAIEMFQAERTMPIRTLVLDRADPSFDERVLIRLSGILNRSNPGFYDDDASDGVDFVGTAMHEIARVLGSSSGASVTDHVTLPNGPVAPIDLDDYVVVEILDLFRFTQHSLPYFDIAPGGDPYFSANGGQTPLAYFHTGVHNGDGFQASHWLDETRLLSAGAPIDRAGVPTDVDLWALDVIGWDVRQVPEPPMNWLVTIAMLTIVAVRRRSTRYGLSNAAVKRR